MIIQYKSNLYGMNGQFQLSCLCGKCFRPVSSSTGGYILSCTDILCLQCSNNGNITSCPACGKHNIQALSLKEPLPDEVSASISDPIIKLDAVINATKFQIKYYKQTLKKLFATMTQLAKENQQLKSIIPQHRNGGDTPLHGTGSSFFREPQQVAPSRASLNQLLSSPVDHAAMPPSASVAAAAMLRPQTSLSMETNGSLLTKRPNTSLRHINDSAEGPPPTQSPHFASNSGWKRSATSDRPFSALHSASSSTANGHRDTKQTGHDTVQWGFGLPVERTGGSVPVRSPRNYDTSSQVRNDGYSHQQGEGSPERPYTARGPGTPTPTNIARPFSAVPSCRSPPPFVTPSRLRSPHLPIVNRGHQSGGGNARSTAAAAMEARRIAAANPLQGVAITLSQSGQVGSEHDTVKQQSSNSSGGGSNSLQDFLRASTGGIQ